MMGRNPDLTQSPLMDRDSDLTQYVLPFVGTQNGGNMFPGPTTPFGMVRLGPDMIKKDQDAYAGYLPDDGALINGFSLTHLSGVGGVPMYGVVSQLPALEYMKNPFTQNLTRKGPDEASVGYYKVQTSDDMKIELAATRRAGIYRYTIPKVQVFHVSLDLSHVLAAARDDRLAQKFESAKLWIDPDSDAVSRGSLTFSNGYNLAPPWTVHFCAAFDPPPFEGSVFRKTSDSNTSKSKINITSVFPRGDGTTYFESDGRPLALDLVWTTGFGAIDTIQSAVAISYISPEQACDTLRAEAPTWRPLEDYVSQTKDEWNRKVLSKVTTTETSTNELQNLYTSLYGMHQMPTNRTGENPLWKSSEPYWDDIYTFWDWFRSMTPLLHILQPEAYDELLHSIVDVFEHEGYLPDARSVNFNGPVQGGSNADNVLADAYVKGAGKNLDWKRAWAAMVKNAEEEPPNNGDPRAPDSSTKEGRGGLSEWISNGFLTTKYSRSVSRGVEYSVNDFALAQVAAGLADPGTFQKYIKRSTNWKNYWNDDSNSNGFRGFLAPRTESGFVLLSADECCGTWKDPLYQGSAWEYGFNVHHDMARLIELCGGNATFYDRLQSSFENSIGSTPPHRAIYNSSSPLSFGLPYLFHYAGRPDRSIAVSRQIFRHNFSPTPTGFPDAAGAGAMQSELLWNMIGLYPITGQTTFLIHSPWFADLRIELGDSRALVINATGIRDRDRDIHVLGLKVNGQEWRQSWLTWTDVFANGGTMEFEIGTEAEYWARGGWFDPKLLPPSPASSPSPVPPTIRREGGPSGAPPNKPHPSPYLAFLVLLVVVAAVAIWLLWRRRAKRKQSTPREGGMQGSLRRGSEEVLEGVSPGVYELDGMHPPPPPPYPDRPPVSPPPA